MNSDHLSVSDVVIGITIDAGMLHMQMINRLYKSLRQKGVLETLKSAARIIADYSFDLKHGTDTMRRVDVEYLRTDSPNKAHATRYQASKTRPLLKLFGELRLPKDGVFVDMGCGKGRVLLIAAQFGFKKVVGIEFCEMLCHNARKNAELFLKKHPGISSIDVIETDIMHYEFKADETVFFLYNPFDSVILKQVLDKLGNSVALAPRDIWLIYNHPAEHEIVQEHWLFDSYRRHEFEGETFHVYEHRGIDRTK